MSRTPLRCAAVVLGLFAAAGAARAQAPTIRAGLEAGTTTRSVKGDDRVSKLNALWAGLRADLDFATGTRLGLTAGAAFTRFTGMTFPELPITLETGSGRMTGILLGARVDQHVLAFGSYELDAEAGFVTALGLTKTWTLEGFAVPGTAKGKPTWRQIWAGPVLRYTASPIVIPRVMVGVDWLSGTVSMDETLDGLTGTHTTDIKGQGLLRIGAGAEIRPMARVAVDVDASAVPRSGGVDFRWSVGAAYLF